MLPNHPAQGHSASTLDIQETHRLPAVSAAQALDDLDEDPSRCVSTGLRELDDTLAGMEGGKGAAGVWRGQVTEAWGPPGVGKTAIGIQLCASALSEGHSAVWVDCAYPICGRRLRTVVEAARAGRQSKSPPRSSWRPGAGDSDEDHDAKEGNAEGPDDEHFVHYQCPTLPHFIAMLCRPVASSIPPGTAVVVIDSLSALLNEAFPKTTDGRKDPKSKKGSGLSTRRLQTLQYVIGALQKLAATRNCAVVLLSQCATRMQAHSRGAALIPAVNASVWEQGIAARLVLFKDWLWSGGKAAEACFAGVERVAGSKVNGLKQVYAFRVGKTGLFPVEYDEPQQTPTRAKRKVGDAGLEIADSDDDDDYGWDPEDEAHLPPEPPQWQGSEDLIVGTQRSDDESEGADEGVDGEEKGGNDERVNEEAVDTQVGRHSEA